MGIATCHMCPECQACSKQTCASQQDHCSACHYDQLNISHHHTCCTSAPVASHRAEMELMDEILCARKALAVSLDSSADHRLAHRIRSSGIQCSYTLFRTFTALLPLSVSFPPMRTCSRQFRCEVSKASLCNCLLVTSCLKGVPLTASGSMLCVRLCIIVIQKALLTRSSCVYDLS